MDYIDKMRADIAKDFNEKTFQKGDFETFISPSNRFRLDATNFWSKETNWDLTRVEIFMRESNEKLFDFFVNDSHFFHGWVAAGNTEYLICAEDIFGGQTIVDLTNLKIAGYSPDKDGFIWTDFHLSPDGRTLAARGCFWASPDVIKFFDFSEPMNLPLKEIRAMELLENDDVILGWLDNVTLRMKITSEAEIERKINISEK